MATCRFYVWVDTSAKTDFLGERITEILVGGTRENNSGWEKIGGEYHLVLRAYWLP
jgi:hypothetical protein